MAFIYATERKQTMPEFVTISEAAECAGTTKANIYRLAQNAIIAAKKVSVEGTRLRIWKVDLDELLEYRERMHDLGSAKHGVRYPGDDETAAN